MTTEMPNECECCPTTMEFLKSISAELSHYMGMWMCPSCLNKEKNAQNELKAGADQRIKDHNIRVNESRNIDLSVTTPESILVSQTVPFIEIQKSIDDDTSIPLDKKNFTYCAELKARFDHFSRVIFDKRKELNDALAAQRELQTELNTKANQLRTEERERLKLFDPSYHPETAKPIKDKIAKDRKPRASKFDPKALKEAAAKYDLKPADIQFLATVKNLSIEAAAIYLKKLVS